jgi:hypothetical protein
MTDPDYVFLACHLNRSDSKFSLARQQLEMLRASICSPTKDNIPVNRAFGGLGYNAKNT